MIIPRTKYRNNQLAVQAVEAYLKSVKSEAVNLTMRPFNRFRLEFTEWLFYFGNYWPAYSRSKLYILKDDKTEMMSLGFYIERGFGPEVLEVYPEKHKQVMQQDWQWHHFIKEIKTGTFVSTIPKIMEQTGLPLTIDLTLYQINQMPDVDSNKVEPWDESVFVIDDASLTMHQVKEAMKDLTPLNHVESISDLVLKADRIKGINWFWLNLYIGVHVQYGDNDTGEWGARELWTNALEPWMPFVH